MMTKKRSFFVCLFERKRERRAVRFFSSLFSLFSSSLYSSFISVYLFSSPSVVFADLSSVVRRRYKN